MPEKFEVRKNILIKFLQKMKIRHLVLKIISILMIPYSVLRSKAERKKTILIFRCGGLGDFLLETVAMHRLREAFPQDQYKIFYVNREFNAETIQLIIPVDRVIVFKEKTFLQLIASAITLWMYRYDIFVNMSDPRYTLSHRILGLCKAKKKIAYAYTQDRFTENDFDIFHREYDVFVNFLWQKDHVMDMTSKLLHKLTGQNYPLPDYDDYIRIHNSIPAQQLNIPQPYIVFSLFGSAENRNLPDEKIKELLRYCKNKFPKNKLVIAGAPKDITKAQVLIASMGELADNLINLCGQTSYCELYYLTKDADFMIGIDSGITHFGALFSRHTFVLVRQHLPELFWPYPEKFMKNITLITAEQSSCDHQCLQCLRTYNPTPCMHELNVESIINAIETEMR